MKQLKLFAFLTLFVSQFSWSSEPINTTWIGNLAVEGYDTVAYFTENKAIKGEKDLEIEWSGANWRFSSQENLELFQSAPEKYAPQYGGYCAWAVSNDALADIDPKQFHIHEDKLYLNYNKTVQEKWLPEKIERIKTADKNFPSLIDGGW